MTIIAHDAKQRAYTYISAPHARERARARTHKALLCGTDRSDGRQEEGGRRDLEKPRERDQGVPWETSHRIGR